MGTEQTPLFCPRCKSAFKCSMDDIGNCQCTAVTLTDATTAFLQKTAFGCLCKSCLVQINSLIEDVKNEHFPVHPSELKEGIHYYIESGNWVFTERYHVLRGSCCKNGCRNCPYGIHVIK